MTYQNLWDAAKEVLRGKLQQYRPNSGNKKISNNLTLHLKELEKEEQTKIKVNKRKEIIKIRKINEMETKKMIEKTNETKHWFFEKTNKIEKPLARFTKKKIEKE